MNQSLNPFEKHLEISDSNLTAISILAKACPEISKQKLKLAMQYGAVWLTPFNESEPNKTTLNKTTRIRRAKKIIASGCKLHLYFNESILFLPVAPAQLISDEGDYSVWNKPCGMFSQGTKWGDHTSIARWVELFGLAKNQLPRRPTFLVHRLDRATSGIILVAHTKRATKALSRLFENREIKKQYRAIVNGEFPEPLLLQKMDSPIDGKDACTIIQTSSYDQDKHQSNLLVEIETGRKHQIRIHLSKLGFPVVGDRLYGIESNNVENEEVENEDVQNNPDLALISCFLEFKCPISNSIKQFQL